MKFICVNYISIENTWRSFHYPAYQGENVSILFCLGFFNLGLKPLNLTACMISERSFIDVRTSGIQNSHGDARAQKGCRLQMYLNSVTWQYPPSERPSLKSLHLHLLFQVQLVKFSNILEGISIMTPTLKKNWHCSSQEVLNAENT